MKKYRRRLSIILALVLVFTSIGFTGAFAVDGEVATDQTEVTAPADDTATTGETAPAADPETTPVEETAAPADTEPAATEESADDTALQAEQTEPEQEPEVEKFTVTWVVDEKKTTTSEVEKDAVPVFDGTPMVTGYTAEDYRFLGWSDGTTTYAPEEALPAVTADITYTAQFASLRVKPAKPEMLKNNNKQAFASYKSVRIEWKPVTEDINGYQYDESVAIAYEIKAKSSKVKLYKVNATSYRTKKNLSPFTTYTFYVKAKIKDTDVTSDQVTIKGSPMKSIRYRLKIKQGSTLKRHAGSGPRTYNLKGGVTIDTDRFQTGKYIFEYKGSIFYISQTRVGSAKALYNKRGSWNYMQKEAEYYIKDRGMGSATKKMIFVNTFCQHAYYFEKKDGKWDCTDGWECGTGLASTPTPTGNYGKKYIHDRIRSKNGIPYWNLFNGNAALHATKPNDHRVGMVISNGCVRNPDAKAKKIYTKCKLKTRVLIV